MGRSGLFLSTSRDKVLLFSRILEDFDERQEGIYDMNQIIELDIKQKKDIHSYRRREI
jgi:hypothetical protein